MAESVNCSYKVLMAQACCKKKKNQTNQSLGTLTQENTETCSQETEEQLVHPGIAKSWI